MQPNMETSNLSLPRNFHVQHLEGNTKKVVQKAKKDKKEKRDKTERKERKLRKYLEPSPNIGPAPLYPGHECMCPGIFSSEFLTPSSNNAVLSGPGPQLEISYGHVISLAMSILATILSVEINDMLPVQYAQLQKFTEFARLEVLSGQGKIPVAPASFRNFQQAVHSQAQHAMQQKTLSSSTSLVNTLGYISDNEFETEENIDSSSPVAGSRTPKLSASVDVVIDEEIESEAQLEETQREMEKEDLSCDKSNTKSGRMTARRSTLLALNESQMIETSDRNNTTRCNVSSSIAGSDSTQTMSIHLDQITDLANKQSSVSAAKQSPQSSSSSNSTRFGSFLRKFSKSEKEKFDSEPTSPSTSSFASTLLSSPPSNHLLTSMTDKRDCAWDPMARSFAATSLFPDSLSSFQSGDERTSSRTESTGPSSDVIGEGVANGLKFPRGGIVPTSLAVFHVPPSEWMGDCFPSAPVFVAMSDLKLDPSESSLSYTFEKQEVLMDSSAVKSRRRDADMKKIVRGNTSDTPPFVPESESGSNLESRASSPQMPSNVANTIASAPITILHDSKIDTEMEIEVEIEVEIEASAVRPPPNVMFPTPPKPREKITSTYNTSDGTLEGQSLPMSTNMSIDEHTLQTSDSHWAQHINESQVGSISGSGSSAGSYESRSFGESGSFPFGRSDSSISPLHYYPGNPTNGVIGAHAAIQAASQGRFDTTIDPDESYQAYSSFSFPQAHPYGASAGQMGTHDDVNAPDLAQLQMYSQRIIGELVAAEVLQSDVEMAVDSIESACDFLLAKRTQYATALMQNREAQLGETRPWEIACTAHSRKLADVIRQKRADEALLRQKLELASNEVAQAKQAVESAIALSLPSSKQKKLNQSLEETRKRRNNYLAAYERIKLERHDATSQLSCVTDILSEMSADLDRLSIAHLERTARTDLALVSFGLQNRNNLLDKVVKLAKLRREGQLVHTKIAAVGIAVRALKLRLAHIITAYWS